MTTAQRKIGSGFDATSTADDVLADIDLHGRTVLLTGGYSGIGLAATEALSRAGAHVVVPARRPDHARAQTAHTSAEVVGLDLGDVAAVRRFTADFVAAGRSVDIVIENAGVMACPEVRVGPGWESQFAINHLGHFALFDGLRQVIAGVDPRVVTLSSAGHFLSGIRWGDIDFTGGYDKWLAYGQSKTATALFAVHLDSLDTGVRAFSVDPGAIATPLQRHVPHDEQVERGWIDAEGNAAAAFKTVEQGAATMVWAATSPQLVGLGGVYCADCEVAEPAVSTDMSAGGVQSWATERDDAARLWELSSERTRQA